jgi:hypothetical protein
LTLRGIALTLRRDDSRVLQLGLAL